MPVSVHNSAKENLEGIKIFKYNFFHGLTTIMALFKEFSMVYIHNKGLSINTFVILDI